METEFELGHQVVIIGNKKQGTVVAKREAGANKEPYSVRYFDNNGRADTHGFFGYELEEAAVE